MKTKEEIIQMYQRYRELKYTEDENFTMGNISASREISEEEHVELDRITLILLKEGLKYSEIFDPVDWKNIVSEAGLYVATIGKNNNDSDEEIPMARFV